MQLQTVLLLFYQPRKVQKTPREAREEEGKSDLAVTCNHHVYYDHVVSCGHETAHEDDFKLVLR